MVRGGGRVLLCAKRLNIRRDQLDCPPLNGLNHYLLLKKTGAHSTGEQFRATMAGLLLVLSVYVLQYVFHYITQVSRWGEAEGCKIIFRTPDGGQRNSCMD